MQAARHDFEAILEDKTRCTCNRSTRCTRNVYSLLQKIHSRIFERKEEEEEERERKGKKERKRKDLLDLAEEKRNGYRLKAFSSRLFSSSLPRTRLTDPRLSFSTRANLIQNKTTSLRSSIARRKKRGRGGRTNLYRNIGQNVRRSIGAHLAPVPLAHSAIRALNFSFPPPPPPLNCLN